MQCQWYFGHPRLVSESIPEARYWSCDDAGYVAFVRLHEHEMTRVTYTKETDRDIASLVPPANIPVSDRAWMVVGEKVPVAHAYGS